MTGVITISDSEVSGATIQLICNNLLLRFKIQATILLTLLKVRIWTWHLYHSSMQL